VFAIVYALAALAAWGRLDAAVLALVTAGFLFAWLWLMPRINQARDSAAEDAASGTRFARLHRLSVLINAAQLVAVLIVFVRLAG